MIRFPDPADAAWLGELKEAGLLTPDVIGRIDRARGPAAGGGLNEFLLAGADAVAEGDWLAWLIREHGCHRFGRARWRDEAAAWARIGPPPDGNLPLALCANGDPIVALLRPDLRAAAQARHPGRTIHWAAATLREMRELHAAWARAAPRRR